MDSILFNETVHANLVTRLAQIGFAADYRQLCIRHGDGNAPPPDVKRMCDLFSQAGVTTKLNNRFKLIEFDSEAIDGWHWRGKLHVQQSGMLEPMLEARHATIGMIGSTWLELAIDCGMQSEAALPPVAFLPPQLPFNRPSGGDPAALVADLILLFRKIKDAVR